MKVIVASRRSQGEVEGDYSWTLDGELVHLPPQQSVIPDRCGCGRGFGGLASYRGTTTAEVLDRDVTRKDVVRAVAESLVRGGWFQDAGSMEAVPTARELVIPLLNLARDLPVGTVVRRRGGTIFQHAPSAA